MTYRVGLVCSAGGHLAQLWALRAWWSGVDRFWVCLDKPDARERLAGERVYWVRGPTNRSVARAVRNAFYAAGVLAKERPDVLVSNGAAVAVPFFAVGRAIGSGLVWIEVPDRIYGPSLTGRLVRRWVDRVVVPDPAQIAAYPGAVVVR
jgi:beta-1,4-N-acetylglucosaminyltransferase